MSNEILFGMVIVTLLVIIAVEVHDIKKMLKKRS